MNTKKLVQPALFTTLALILSLAEGSLPPLAPIPGIKLGLANVVTLYCLQLFSPVQTFCMLLSRILLASLFTGQAISLLYSLCGGMLCFLCMWCTNRLLGGHYVPLTSVVGGITHNTGQILTAWLITSTPGVLTYLPVLLISGLVTGLFTGLCAHFSIPFLKRLRF